MAVYAPKDLDAKSKRLWNDTQAQLVAQDTWVDTDAPLLERYVRALELSRHALARILERERQEKGTGWTSWGAQRQLVQHPDVKTMREGLRDAHTYAEALLLTPKARKQNEIASGVKDPGPSKFGI